MGGFLQELLNPNMPIVPNDFVKIFSGELITAKDETVLTVLGNCDSRVFACYGCSCNFKNNGHEPPPPFDFTVVKKMRENIIITRQKMLGSTVKCILSYSLR